MNASPFAWHARPGLAGGIDQTGLRAEELLGIGFGSVEFGTVAAHPQAPFGLAALVERLAALAPRPPGASAIGIGIGLPPEAAPDQLPAFWRAGLAGAWPVADYVSFNLSARAYRPLLAPQHLPLLVRALRSVAADRDALPRPVPLALKFPLGGIDEAFAPVADEAAKAGFELLTAVLPDADGRFDRLAKFIRRQAGGPAVVAVGGIRDKRDVAAARSAGAAGVQVHRVFAESGAACLPALLASKRETGASPCKCR